MSDQSQSQIKNDKRVDPIAMQEGKDESLKLKQPIIRTSSAVTTQINFDTSSLFKIGLIVFFSKYQKGILKVLGSIILATILLAIADYTIGENNDAFSKGLEVLRIIFIDYIWGYGIVNVVKFIFVWPYTSLPIWFGLASYAFFTYIFTRDKETLTIVYWKGETYKQLFFDLSYDRPGKWYIGVKADFWVRLFLGTPRYPFDSEFYRWGIHQTASMEIVEVTSGSIFSSKWKGHVMWVLTNPNDNRDDDDEVAEIIQIRDEYIEETDSYRRTIFIPQDKIISMADIRKLSLGDDLGYKQGYFTLKNEIVKLQTIIDDLKIDKVYELGRELLIEKSTRARKMRRDLIESDEALKKAEDQIEDAIERFQYGG